MKGSKNTGSTGKSFSNIHGFHRITDTVLALNTLFLYTLLFPFVALIKNHDMSLQINDVIRLSVGIEFFTSLIHLLQLAISQYF